MIISINFIYYKSSLKRWNNISYQLLILIKRIQLGLQKVYSNQFLMIRSNIYWIVFQLIIYNKMDYYFGQIQKDNPKKFNLTLLIHFINSSFIVLLILFYRYLVSQQRLILNRYKLFLTILKMSRFNHFRSSFLKLRMNRIMNI